MTVQPWTGEVLEFIATADLWRTTLDAMVRVMGAFQARGAAGFIAQFYPPYDFESIERLAVEVAPHLGSTARRPTAD